MSFEPKKREKNTMKQYYAGIDIGSTTVKLAVLDDSGKQVFGAYRRHRADTQGALAALLEEAVPVVGDAVLRVGITGSGAINLGKALEIPFVQEVVAVATVILKEALMKSTYADLCQKFLLARKKNAGILTDFKFF